MDSTRVQSFTEKALLNRWALNFFSPMTQDPVPLESISGSVFESVIHTKTNPFNNREKNQTFFFKGTHLLVTTPIRVAYVGLTALYVSRLGALYNGVMVGISCVKYRVSSKTNDQTAELIKKYAAACFQDLFCSILGAFCAKIIFESAVHLTYLAGLTPSLGSSLIPTSRSGLIKATLRPFFAIALGIAPFIFIQTPLMASQCLAREEERCGMYISFTLRNKLGIVNQEGGLLQFSSKDCFTHKVNGTLYYNDNLTKLEEVLSGAEGELIRLAADVNRLLTTKLPFTYPLQAGQIASHARAELSKAQPQYLEQSGNELVVSSPLQKLEESVVLIGRKIDILLNLYVRVQDLSVNYSLPTMILLRLFGLEVKPVKTQKPKSLLDEQEYQNLFTAYTSSEALACPPDKMINWKDEILLATPLGEPPSEENLYETFKYSVKQLKIDHPDQVSYNAIAKLLGLEKGMEYFQFRKIEKKYMIALHPDKQPLEEQPLTQVLFRIARQVLEDFRKEEKY